MLVKFTSWLKNLNEGVFGNWNYHVPQDKEQQMYDFYMMEYLLPSGAHFYLRPTDFGGYDTDQEAEEEDVDRIRKGLPSLSGKKAGDMKRTVEDKFHYALYEVVDKLLPALKKEMQSAIIFAVGAELRHFENDVLNSLGHAYSASDVQGATDSVNRVLNKMESSLGPQYSDLLRKYIRNYLEAHTITSHQPPLYKSFLKGVGSRPELDRLYKGSGGDYRKSVKAMKKSGGSDEDWITIAKWLFKYTSWQHMFGGDSWAQIADAWLHLERVKAPTHLIAYIDHVYDLQHNTGSLFTKIKKYAKKDNSGSMNFKWIQKALDHKRDLISAHEMIEHVSPSMRELALIGIKLKTGKSWEDFVQDWPEIVQQKTEVYNQQKLKERQKEKEKEVKKYEIMKEKSIVKWEKEKHNAWLSWRDGWGPMTPEAEVDAKEKFTHDWEKSHPKPKHKSAADFDREWETYNPKPTPISVKTFENGLEDSGSPYSVAKLTQKYRDQKEVEKQAIIKQHGGSDKIPAYEDMKMGDSIAFEWPSKKWFVITGRKPSDKSVHPTYGQTPDIILYKTDMGDNASTDWKAIKGYKKVEKPFNKPAPTPLPAEADPFLEPLFKTPKPPVVLPKPSLSIPLVDAHSKEIKINDKVKKVVSKFDNKFGVVKHLLPTKQVGVQWNNYYGVYPPNELIVVSDIAASAPPAPTPSAPVAFPAASAPVEPWHGVPSPLSQSQSKPPEVKPEPPKPEVKPAPKPVSTPGGVDQINGDDIKNKWAEFPSGIPHKLRVARLTRLLKRLYAQQASYNEIYSRINQELNFKITTDEAKTITELIMEELDKETYYQSRGAYKFPEKMNEKMAFSILNSNFSNPPHVFLDSETLEKIHKAFSKNDNMDAVKLIRSATGFSLSAGKGLVILLKLEYYMGH